MATQVQLRGGTTSEHSSFTGAAREVTVDTDKDVVVVHDGSTAGGIPLAKEASVLPLAGGALTGAVTTTSTFDGRNVSVDGGKLDAIEASADVTDTTNVTAAGALMDSEVTNLAQVKAFDTTDYATAAQGTTADAALPKAGGTMTGTIAGFTSTGIDDNATSEKLDITDTAVKVGTAVNLHTDYTDTSGSIIYTKDNGSSTALADPNYYALQISNPYTGSTPLAGQKPAKIQFTTITSDGYSASGSIALVARGTAYGEGDIVISTGAASSPANHSTETVRFPSTGGIRFNGDTSTANSLDDYEEGTWTATVQTGSGSGTKEGRYTKIGRMVYIDLHNMGGEMSGNCSAIGGLPFATGTGPTNGAFAGVITGDVYIPTSVQGVNIRAEGSVIHIEKDAAAYTIDLGTVHTVRYCFSICYRVSG